jgi:hypothetical protein
MNNFFAVTWTRIKKIWYSVLSVPAILLIISIAINMDDIYKFAFAVCLLTKRQIDKILGLGFWKK